MQNIQKYRVICKILKTRRLWLRFIVKERPARRHIMCLCLLEIIGTAKSRFFAELAGLEERSLHHGMMVQFQKEVGRTRDYCVAKNATLRRPDHAKMGVTGSPGGNFRLADDSGINDDKGVYRYLCGETSQKPTSGPRQWDS